MLEPIVGFFDKLIDQFTWRRLVFLAVIIGVAAGGLIVFETYTQHFKLGRIERQAALLEKLSALANSPGAAKSDKVNELTSSLLNQLRETDVSIPFNYELLPWARKALAAAAAWLVFGLFIALIPNTYTRTEPATGSVVAGMTVVASPFIALAAFLPTAPWLNYFFYPIGHIFLLGALLSWLSFAVRRRFIRKQAAPSGA